MPVSFPTCLSIGLDTYCLLTLSLSYVFNSWFAFAAWVLFKNRRLWLPNQPTPRGGRPWYSLSARVSGNAGRGRIGRGTRGVSHSRLVSLWIIIRMPLYLPWGPYIFAGHSLTHSLTLPMCVMYTLPQAYDEGTATLPSYPLSRNTEDVAVVGRIRKHITCIYRRPSQHLVASLTRHANYRIASWLACS